MKKIGSLLAILLSLSFLSFTAFGAYLNMEEGINPVILLNAIVGEQPAPSPTYVTRGLIQALMFDSQDLTDSSGNGYDGSVGAGVPTYTTGANGIGYALVGDGSTWINLGTNANLFPTTAVTYDFDLYVIGDGIVFDFGNSSIGSAQFIQYTSPKVYPTLNNAKQINCSFGSNAWYHCCMTYDKSRFKFWTNGGGSFVLAATDTYAPDLSYAQNITALMARASGATIGRFRIDNWRVHNVAFTDGGVTAQGQAPAEGSEVWQNYKAAGY